MKQEGIAKHTLLIQYNDSSRIIVSLSNGGGLLWGKSISVKMQTWAFGF